MKILEIGHYELHDRHADHKNEQDKCQCSILGRYYTYNPIIDRKRAYRTKQSAIKALTV